MKTGFTLIELSIVLVIIGLIVGGIIVGGDLIKAAEYRMVIAQIEEYKTATQTFKGKYNCLPGDCDSAVNFGLGQTAGPGDNGDGNGRLSSTVGIDVDITKVPENFHFWVHLANASFIKSPDTPYVSSMGNTPSKTVMPTLSSQGSQIGLCYGCFIRTPADEYQAGHYFIVGRLGSDTGAAYYQTASFKPMDMLVIDTKTDDGLPMTGNVTPSFSDNDAVFEICPFCSVVTNCIDTGGSLYTYNIANDDVTCSMGMRAGF